jgi:REJ domain
MPLHSSIELKLNQEPIFGVITVTPSSLEGDAFTTQFTFKVDGFIDDDLPLSYKFSLYLSVKNYKFIFFFFYLRLMIMRLKDSWVVDKLVSTGIISEHTG